MKCNKCGADLPSPRFPEFKNWIQFMNKKLKKIIKEKQYG